MTAGDIQMYLADYLANPVPWAVVLTLTVFVSTVLHEIGHAIAIRAIGAEITELRLGQQFYFMGFITKGLVVRIGLPLGGSCHYNYSAVPRNRYLPLKLAYVGAGGWIVDAGLYFAVINPLFMETPSSPFLALVWGFMSLKVVVGLTPLTGDGRLFVSGMIRYLTS